MKSLGYGNDLMKEMYDLKIGESLLYDDKYTFLRLPSCFLCFYKDHTPVVIPK